MAQIKPAVPVAEGKPQPVRLVNAGESTDPAIHRLIAELHTAWSNGDTSTAQRIESILQLRGYRA
jgi:hypothetical protein